MNIRNLKISQDKPLFVAEISGNHSGKINLLKKTICSAIDAGANAIKLQSYKPEDLTINVKKKDFLIRGSKNKWEKKYLYNIYEEGQTPLSWYKDALNICNQKNILCFSSPFSLNAVKELNKLNCPVYKVASLEITNIPLLKQISLTKKPVIISTGAAKLSEIKKAVRIFKNNKNVALLKCTVNYPSNLKDLNLLTIKDLKKQFPNCEVGYSDHTIGSTAAMTAVGLGASIIEKHFILNKKIKSIDNFFSSTSKEFEELVLSCKDVIKCRGSYFYGPTMNEKSSLKYRRSIYISENIKKGETINKNNIKIVRPSFGLDISYYDKIIGKKTKKKLFKGDKIFFKDLF